MCDDNQIRSLLQDICGQEPPPTALARAKALHRLLVCIDRSPKLFRSSHQDYSYALNRTFSWVSENIGKFSSQSPSISEDLIRWVNGYLKWRIRDLYTPDTIYEELIKAGFKPTELDKPVADEGRQTRHGDLTADPRPSRMNDLDRCIETIQKEAQERVGQQIKDYLEKDPHDVLKQCHLRNEPGCNCQELVLRLHLSDPPETVRAIAKRFNINEQTLHSHWKKKCLPLLQIIALRFDAQVKEYIQLDPDQLLRGCHPQESTECDCWELSKRLILANELRAMSAIAKDLRISQPTLDRHWREQCLPLLKKHRLEYPL